MQCKNCNKNIPDEALFCCFCGKKINLTCSKCGHELLPDANFCFKCGTAVDDDVKTVAQTKPVSSETNSKNNNTDVLNDDLMKNLAKVKENVLKPVGYTAPYSVPFTTYHTLGDCDCSSREFDCDGSI